MVVAAKGSSLAVIYRTLRPDEQDAVLDLWVTVLDDDRDVRERVFYDFADDPQRFEHTHVAVDPDGNLLAAVAYWLRDIRDSNGQPRRTAHIWGVATRPDARGEGHASRLLQQALAPMQQKGCYWSLLCAREEARTLYTRLGWQNISTSYRSGVLSTVEAAANPYHIKPYDPRAEPDGWERLATVYAGYNATRPLTMLRDDHYWRGYAAWMFADWIAHHCATVFVATRTPGDRNLAGYILAHFYDQEYAQRTFGSPPWFYVSEIGITERNSDLIPALLSTVAQEAIQRGMAYGQLALPHEPQVDAALEHLFGQSPEEQTMIGSLMMRGLTPDAEQELAISGAAPGAIFWELDRY
jgi:ribosomal protein S18 acetylase RimI-like enzyme